MYFNSKGDEEVTYDAIVVGSGISGGWAAKELAEKGLKTIVLERGRKVEHIVDYTTASMEKWDFKGNTERPTQEQLKDYEVQARSGYTVNQGHSHWFVKDTEHPFVEVKPFNWMRGYHLGGRSITWGRQSYRLSEMDFEANAKDGTAVDWPIRYADMKPWYDYVETHIGVSGQNEGLAQLPDGKYLPPMEMNCVEQKFKKGVAGNFGGRMVTMGRTAHLTGQLSHNKTSKRGQCQFRNRCMRGCPYGAYFSSLSSTLPVAEQTGNLTIVCNSIVAGVIYDPETNKAKGVRVIDALTKETREVYAKIIFLNASAIATASILLNSKSERFPNGLGNDSGELGHNIMDHHLGVGARGEFEGFQDKYYKGRRPNGVYVPRFRNIDNASMRKDYIRGFGYQGGASREGWYKVVKEMKLGKELMESLQTPGYWTMGIMGFGECLPDHRNKMFLDEDNLDPFGMPMIHIDAEWQENELIMRNDMATSAAEMLEAAGAKNVSTYETINNNDKKNRAMGIGIHEMGTARMGRDPKTSVLNKYNQIHACQNVYITDGAAMTSAGCQNPSLTYMALTARAADHAVSELKKMNL
ncbi:GMC oxidoreductase [Portibacter lacus]|uniref:GMC family oxidoreductase n=1 Tax=Portibacter lacus TaxID=1099794 RepID=A0AA37SUZ7_9BACT|nr:GMC family oxidoreductase [Portibacter lacus]GLR19630.1 GMC family oxidoreductase [Portibacter lacus]